jgi:hypothetical protein
MWIFQPKTRVGGQWRFWPKNPEYQFVIHGILVFWYSGLAALKTRFLSWEVAFLRKKSRIPVWAQVVFW